MTPPILSPEDISGIVYDFDGTLVDSFSPIHQSFNHMLLHFGLDTVLTFDQMLSLVGGPLVESVSRLLPPHLVSGGTEVFRAHYEKIYLGLTVPMAGAQVLLETLCISGRPQCVVTNKLGRSARELIGHFGWEDLLPVCLGEGDGYRLKPTPDMILAAVSRMGLGAGTILFVGDSPFDFGASRAAGVPVCLLSTGTHRREELIPLSPDLLFDNLGELKDWFAQGV